MKKEALKRKVDEIINGQMIQVEEALELVKYENLHELSAYANTIRETLCGNHFDLCSITNARSGLCGEDCKWCSQSIHFNTKVPQYEFIPLEQVVKEAKTLEQQGVHRHSLVTSGKALNKSNIKHLIGTYKVLKREAPKLKYCASLGLIDKTALQSLVEAGVDHYHCNLETAPSHFHTLCSSHTIEDKKRTIQAAQEVGLKVCSGGIIGMGETMEQRIEMAFALRELGIKSIPINILMPIEGTPLEGCKPLTDEEVIRTFIIFRFINPNANIRLAGGRCEIKHVEERLLAAGVNASIVGDLLTTMGSSVDEDLKMVQSAGFNIK
ncbi:biotin synthase BioB [Halosquirtibacter xylanolyticus]|uniref:biotin synthase BioB n=1 Tax=Halosquirtibacter xylanolyticus TaxID=3374599 RepID=UPI003749BC90|nr:biotin synthase BioB [Prolixibacteraceae bacterium]